MNNLKPHLDLHSPPKARRNRTEIISLIVGVTLFIMGIASLPFPSVFGLTLTMGHCLIIAVSGGVLAWNGRFNKSRNCFYACSLFGLFFLTHAFAGFIVDVVLGTDAISFFEDRWLLNLLPDYFILGPRDHVFNLVIGLILIGGAYDWWGHYNKIKFVKVSGPSVFEDKEHNHFTQVNS